MNSAIQQLNSPNQVGIYNSKSLSSYDVGKDGDSDAMAGALDRKSTALLSSHHMLSKPDSISDVFMDKHDSCTVTKDGQDQEHLIKFEEVQARSALTSVYIPPLRRVNATYFGDEASLCESPEVRSHASLVEDLVHGDKELNHDEKEIPIGDTNRTSNTSITQRQSLVSRVRNVFRQFKVPQKKKRDSNATNQSPTFEIISVYSPPPLGMNTSCHLDNNGQGEVPKCLDMSDGPNISCNGHLDKQLSENICKNDATPHQLGGGDLTLNYRPEMDLFHQFVATTGVTLDEISAS